MESLVGAGESGKSTILKQMKLLHDNGFSDEEKEAFKEIIFSNLIQSIKTILDAMDKLDIKVGSPENQKHIDFMNAQHTQLDSPNLPEDVCKAIKTLWTDSGVQACYLRSNEYQLNDSAK